MRRAMNIVPRRGGRVALALLPFLLIAMIYGLASTARHVDNPDDKLLPVIGQMTGTMAGAAFAPDRRTGEFTLWTDTIASLTRLGIGIGLAALIGLSFGMAIGLLPIAGASLGPLAAVISMIPPMAVLPILFIVFGLGDLSKVVLIVFGIAPFLIRDLALAVEQLPREQMVKAQSLGASTWQIAIRVVLPQIAPRLIEDLRLSLGPAFLFLISAEAIAAEAGLGYRIFLVRRFLQMDLILPYVAWITLLAYVMDFVLARLSRAAFPWAHRDARAE
jgi:NitT/TauT family transport system permease protein